MLVCATIGLLIFLTTRKIGCCPCGTTDTAAAVGIVTIGVTVGLYLPGQREAPITAATPVAQGSPGGICKWDMSKNYSHKSISFSMHALHVDSFFNFS